MRAVGQETGMDGILRPRLSWTVLGTAIVLLLLSMVLGTVPAAGQENEQTPAGEADTAEEVDDADPNASQGGETGEAGQGPLAPPAEGFEPLNPGLIVPEMTVQVWPEYDEPEVLVLADVYLPETVTFPYTFSYYVPKGARNTGIAEVNENDEFVYSMTPQIQPGEEMDLITLEVPEYRHLRLEYYYDPGLNLSGERSFPFQYLIPADVGELVFSIQEPVRSQGFSVDPPLATTSQDAEGFSYAVQTFSEVDGGSEFGVQVSYSKDDAEPSIDTGGSGAGSTSEDGGGYFIWMVTILGVGMAGMVGYWVATRRTSAAPAGRSARSSGDGRRGRQPRQPSGKAQSGGGSGPARFCTECGAKLGKKDRFCSECGHERE